MARAAVPKVTGWLSKTFRPGLGGRMLQGAKNVGGKIRQSFRDDPLGSTMNTVMAGSMAAPLFSKQSAFNYLDARNKLAFCMQVYQSSDNETEKNHAKEAALENLLIMGQ